MAEEVFIPKFGQTVEEVVLGDWLVEDGQKVAAGQPLLEVETDKAVFSVEAPARGYIHLGPFKAGDTVPVVTVVAVIGSLEDRFTADSVSQPITAVQVEELPDSKMAVVNGGSLIKEGIGGEGEAQKIFASPRARKFAREHRLQLDQVIATGNGGARIIERDAADYLASLPKLTPVAKKMAEEAKLDPGSLPGTGPQGRITRADVENALQKNALPSRNTLPTPSRADSLSSLPENEILERIPLKGVRGIVSSRMAASVHTTARVTLIIEVDATAFTALRSRLKTRFSSEWGFAPGYNELLAKVVSAGLRRFPYMNARLNNDLIEQLARIHIGMAVDTPRGLVVPVLRNVEQKSLQEIGTEFRRLVQNAQSGSLLPDEMSGGTFTITNLGMYDITAFTPVINLPEVAILGVGKISPALAMRDGQVVETQKLTLSLVFDHRLVDGAPAARFLQFIKDLIEDPALLVLF